MRDAAWEADAVAPCRKTWAGLSSLTNKINKMLVSHLLHSLHIPLRLLTGPTRPHGLKQAPGGEGVVGTGMDRIGKVGCGRGVHTAHAQYYSLLISLKLPGSNTLCATHAKGTGHVLPSSPVSQLPVLTHPRNILFFFFHFSLCESAPSNAHPSPSKPVCHCCSPPDIKRCHYPGISALPPATPCP